MLDVRYKSVNFAAKTCPVSPSGRAVSSLLKNDQLESLYLLLLEKTFELIISQKALRAAKREGGRDQKRMTMSAATWCTFEFFIGSELPSCQMIFTTACFRISSFGFRVSFFRFRFSVFSVGSWVDEVGVSTLRFRFKKAQETRPYAPPSEVLSCHHFLMTRW